MAEINVPSDEEWDLSEILAERKQPTTKVDVYLDEEASFIKDELVRKQAAIPANQKAKLATIDEAIAEIDNRLEEAKFTFHLQAVPARMREDLNSKALSEYPVKRASVLSQDENESERNDRFNQLIWHAMIRDVERNGKHRKVWTPEQIKELYDSLPNHTTAAISTAIRELTEASEKYTVAQQDLDF